MAKSKFAQTYQSTASLGKTMHKGAILTFLTLLLAVCGGERANDTQVPKASEHVVKYLFGWHSENAIIAQNKITLTNDLGYEIIMTTGYAVAYTVSLIECSDPEEQEETSDIGELLLELLGPRKAWAGHGYGIDNPAALPLPQMENILDQGTTEFGRRTVEPNQYCQFFYLVGRADSSTLGLPAEPNIVGLSIYIAGTYQLEDGPIEEFVLNSVRANSFLSELYAPGEYGQLEK